MVALNFVIVDVFEFRKVGSIEADMKTYLDTKLGELTAFANKNTKGGANHSAKVSFTETKPSATNLDFVIYLIHPQHSSLVAAKEGIRDTQPPGSHWGRTSISPASEKTKKSASHLRTLGKSGADLGAIALHEFYHAKTQLADAQLHPKKGICDAGVSAATVLNDVNKSDFMAFITRPVEQWLDGVPFLSFSYGKYKKDQASDWWDFMS